MKTYQIKHHPKPCRVYDWMRENYNGFGDYNVDYFEDSLDRLADEVKGKIDHSISLDKKRRITDEGNWKKEFIHFNYYDEKLLKELDPNFWSLTGAFTDAHVIRGAQNGELEKTVLNTIHLIGMWTFSAAGIHEFVSDCKCLFNADGSLVSMYNHGLL
tara:strand:+ start:751 stop:1224 length:474 start_codon:yes stop_codon:yes gene_type:complete